MPISKSSRAPFSWWGCHGLCLRHKPAELAHSFYSVFVSVSVFGALSTAFQFINHPVHTGSPSRVGDVAVYVFDINQPSLPTPFYLFLVSFFCLIILSTVFHSINSPDNPPLFLCSSGLISAFKLHFSL